MRLLSALRRRLLSLRADDERVRAELDAQGVLHGTYHPQMEQVHRRNADALNSIVGDHGWPTERMVRPDGAEAAWLIAQHAISRPDLMRGFRSLIDAASQAGDVPRWQFAYIDDRINVFEGRPQRFGTQIDLQPAGAAPCEIEAPEAVDLRRAALGLAPLADALARAATDPMPSPARYEAHKAEELAWRKAVGWID